MEQQHRKKREMGSNSRLNLFFLICFIKSISPVSSEIQIGTHNFNGGDEGISTDFSSNVYKNFEGQVIELKSEPKDVAWVVQLSDLHFSVHHPERALDFESIIGPTLAMINPSLVLITGDLTDGKSKDFLTMKLDEEEWIEYKNIMENVVKKSGLNKSIFYDLRGNHDNFGMSSFGSSSDFFSRYSLNGQQNRSGQVNSIVIETGERKILFVGFDSTTPVGLRGPTNLFGHPTDELLSQLSSALSQWDSSSVIPITKLSFGHFPLSFSAASSSGKTLKDTFLKCSLSAYLCGHLHTKFGENLKRNHRSNEQPFYADKLYQLNPIEIPSERANNCSEGVKTSKEFWEWEMGDWRKSRAMRILAIDRGYMSFVDVNFKLGSKKTILLPTFPLDSRFATTLKHGCLSENPSLHDTIRVLVFSSSPIVSVIARIYDSRSEFLVLVFDASMRKAEGSISRGDLYSTPWNFKAFEDPSPERFLLQVEATDIAGRSTLSELRPFSVSGLNAKLSWTWKEFIVMGCQWSALYYPIFWSLFSLILSIILIPKVFVYFTRKQYTFQNFVINKGFRNCLAWILTEPYNIPMTWYSLVVYMFYLILCPWLLGRVFIDGEERGYMTYRGWMLKNNTGKGLLQKFAGFPDIMVIVLPHLFFVVLPAVLVIGALAAEKGIYHNHLISLCRKKDDAEKEHSWSPQPTIRNKRRWIRKVLLVICLVICWKHFKSCRALVKAYDMNPIFHFPFYSLFIPLLLAYTAYKTGKS